ncbi:hypothetical protein [Clostridium sp. OS1-26]|uniref:hypothetical protein n=1 Tax=Clostridium sp. OS1-26 TaxID=3070681 RepID=UPI0027E11C01|nr:hypothetical protein [Clostridium sp. OS1-26]WML35930.1 hypothetical protein RCG18_04065 [Clostridium sp. OS1-26]
MQSVNGKTGTVSLIATDVGAATSAQGIKADTALQSSQLGQAGGPAKQNDFMSHLADSLYQTAGGTATAITLTIGGTLINGYPITFIASANNNSSATTINTKPLYKPGTTTAPNLISGKAYTVWYNQASNCFFIKASAEGDAGVGDVLAGKKFSNDTDTGLVGTMPNKSSVTISSTADSQLQYGGIITDQGDPGFRVIFPIKNLPTGYYDANTQINVSLWGVAPQFVQAGAKIGRWDSPLVGTYTSDATATAPQILSSYTAYANGSKVTGTMPNNGAYIIPMSYTYGNISIPAGYHNGAGYIQGFSFSIGSASALAIPVWNGNTFGYTYVKKIAECVLNFSGSVRVIYTESKNYYGAGAVSQVYVNDVARGVSHPNASTNTMTYTDDITINAGDRIQIYGASGSNSGGMSISNIKILCDKIPGVTIGYSNTL